jgi:hypothetical protein
MQEPNWVRCALCSGALSGRCTRVVPHVIEYKTRKIRPSHRGTLTGKVPLRAGKGMVPFESGLERDTLLWLRDEPGLTSIKAQPFTVKGWIDGLYAWYTPDLLVTFAPVPKMVAMLGFQERTIVEVKPASLADDQDVLLKLCLARRATGIAVVLVSDFNLAEMEGCAYVH